MLRSIVILLFLANIGYFAWSQHGLGFVGLQPTASQARKTNTEEVGGQVNAEKLALISPQQLTKAMVQNQEIEKVNLDPAQAPVSRSEERVQETRDSQEVPEASVQTKPPAVCMAVSGLNDDQLQAVKGALKGLPSSAWSVEESTTPGRWMIFWGSFNDDLEFAAKRSQLVAKGIGFDPVRNSQAGRGFSLGRYSSENAAQQESKRIAQQGIGNLRVIKEREDTRTYAVRFQDYENHRARIQSDLRRLLQEKSLRAC